MTEINTNLHQNDEKKKYGEGLEQLMIQSIHHHLKHGSVWRMSVHDFQWRWLLRFSDDDDETEQKTEAAGWIETRMEYWIEYE